MIDLQRQAKTVADELEANSAWLSSQVIWNGLVRTDMNAVSLLRRIERGELREVVTCGECMFTKPIKDSITCGCVGVDDTKMYCENFRAHRDDLYLNDGSRHSVEMSVVELDGFCDLGRRKPDANS